MISLSGLQSNTTFSVTSILLLVFLCMSCKTKSNENNNETAEMKVTTGEYLKEVYKSKNGDLNYRILYPNGFDPSKKYPVLLFLHGAGERGDDNEAQLVHGNELILNGMNTYQGIAILPQCPLDDYWVPLIENSQDTGRQRTFDIDVSGAPTKSLQRVIELVDDYLKNDYVDKSRIYVSGLSMGGMGTFDLCWRKPKTFAAAMPICGAGSVQKASDIAHIPMRIFHGEEDAVVPVEASKEMAKAIQKAGGEPTLFLYPEVNHNSWDNAFDEPDFLSWLFKHKKK